MIFMMGFGMIIFLAIVFIIFKLSKQNNNAFFYNDDNSALNILRERFAKGEINEEEYNKMKAALKK
ncbi:SHOCT domain-containing protein [Clostridium felsineum]|nr:SHOCT domain-containing protein [Clostridium felsineum]